MKRIKINDIVIDAGTQIRVSISEDIVSEYAEALIAKDKFPPLIIFNDGNRNLLADGFHRVHAALRNGQDAFDCEIHEGTLQDAIKFALGCNTAHGLRRTNADKNNAVDIALREFLKFSDRKLAEICAVSHSFVAEKRGQLATVASCLTISGSESAPEQKRIGQDGRSRSIPSRSKIPPRKTESVPEKTFDETGLEIPEEIVPFWERGAEAQELISQISHLRSQIKSKQENSDPLYACLDFNSVLANLNQVYVEVQTIKPYAVCPTCNGITIDTTLYRKGDKVLKNQCVMCKNRGFISEHFWKKYVPEETKKVTGRK